MLQGFSKAGFPDGGMFRKRLEKVILLLCLSVTTAVLVYWRVHNQELATIIIEQAIEDPYLSLPSNVKENGAWVDRLPRGVVVWSQPLAGSLGVGKLLTSGLKNSLVSFEPFAPEQPIHRAPEDNTTLHHHRLSLLNDLLHCRYFRHKDLVDHLSSRSSFLSHNSFLRSRCVSVPEKCLSNGTFISHICHEASVHFLKVLRLDIRWVRPLLEDVDLDLKVIYLARDPRALVYSRRQDPRCNTRECEDPAQVCAKLREDLAEVPFLLQDFPESFKYLKYEDLAVDTNGTAVQDLLIFVETDESSSAWVQKGVASDAFLWRKDMAFDEVLEVQDVCEVPLRALGYRIFVNEEEFGNPSVSVMNS
ncbi:carbohydrate sulfotransferase 1-like [Penaeus monodon]|uniref:carbohydrate sulfotransferase 1-like n=1 Tax=Penaeus monodon TaxID=6687 RepID=UPI0018A75ECE|nr:carbohydrate sulfotransferase 1-like [Penaeus monodon]